MNRNISHSLAIIVVVTTLFLIGCASPYPKRHSISSQKKMQSAHHWDVLATDVAEQIKQTLEPQTLEPQTSEPQTIEPQTIENYDINKYKPIYVKESNETPFGKTFRDLLITRMVEKGIKVTKENGPDVLLEENNVRVVHHISKRDTVSLYSKNSVFNVLSGEIIVLRGGKMAVSGKSELSSKNTTSGLFHTEVVINSSLLDGDSYLMRKSDIYYINDPDFWHYENLELQEQEEEKELKTKGEF
ncbi:MAG: hypothetical protein ABII68_00220 [Pseudomonadota bacterium]